MAAIGGPPWRRGRDSVAYRPPTPPTDEQRLLEAVTDAQTRATGVHQLYHRIHVDEARPIRADRAALAALFTARYPDFAGSAAYFASRVAHA